MGAPALPWDPVAETLVVHEAGCRHGAKGEAVAEAGELVPEKSTPKSFVPQ